MTFLHQEADESMDLDVAAAVVRKAILDVSGQVPPEVLHRLLAACKATRFQEVQKEVSAG